MKNFYILSDALDYIEAHLSDEVSQQDLAKACCCSVSSLQKLFRYALRISIADYVTRRRLTCCARELVLTDRSVLEIAMDYGFNSAEVFTRAFTRVWGESPTRFRKNRRFYGICPKLELNENIAEGGPFMRRKYDISELYDYLNERRGTWLAAFDIKELISINGISRKAGDLAILESLHRIQAAAEEDMLVIRVGGDEFVMATGLADEKKAAEITHRVTDRNGEPIMWEDREIPLFLYAGIHRIEDRNLRYSELFPAIQQVLDQSRME